VWIDDGAISSVHVLAAIVKDNLQRNQMGCHTLIIDKTLSSSADQERSLKLPRIFSKRFCIVMCHEMAKRQLQYRPMATKKADSPALQP
jgi:hypothetical protein